MLILLAYMYGDKYGVGTSSGDSVARALKALGHEVVTCGPRYGNYNAPLSDGHDIPVLDKRMHPETYTYNEILNRMDKKPDLIFQIDSHFYFVGEKPDIPCVYWIHDVHRTGDTFRKMAVIGKFDHVFIAQKYYMPIYQRAGLNCHYLPFGYDDLLVQEQKNIQPVCDIVFAGSTGILNNLNHITTTDKATCLDRDLDVYYYNFKGHLISDPEMKYAAWENNSLEYADRAELLLRLSQDFNVRVYYPDQLDKYSKMISKGILGFHCSLRRDITLRTFEVPACNRLLLTDEIPYLDELMEHKKHLITYRKYFQPQFASFDMDYEEVKDFVIYYLKHEEERKQISLEGMNWVKSQHTFKHRMQAMFDIIKDKI